ncbi:Malate dehydrogenase (oxaloacetate-decarboxylating) (NADP(+)) [Vitreoscilla filiformis]|jgi:malate dehydrogenase (oxaloacetate-decarboxylating)(NADP+)|uniref:Malate dehydrogenase (Oxaloacetate-decarboxylating) (NADP(+)) n=1 Tax=Vitreoscilla filiformis TaxID=63 RepID=A0A221KDH5_VITFI|nr:NADP-dependent malic enzyme [Vitreoscilla filiformis]ASM77061.1 Malate dehydrogenase (oxaloacetate-decarboxylating) (NADP(+)) [Vitreoscilla filiformis]
MPQHDLTPAEQALRDAALEYHRAPTRGKIAVTPTKPLVNQRDLSLAYSPGVAYACLAIEENPALAADYTSRANLVGVVTNGTAVLGLGNIGPLAGKPVMEGKGCLFKKFAGVDVFDIELAENDPDKLVEIIAALEPTLGGVNLEDIKAPECFYIERKLRDRMNIPVFHDDQHGTAIISSAALLNGLELVGKKIDEVKVAVSGAGAAAIACLDLMVSLGVSLGNVYVCDSKGLIQSERADALAGKLDESKQRYCQKTDARTLADVVNGADVFLGCSAAGTLTADMVKTMAANPLILALANPEPEIRPELAKAVRPDCIIATGRSDYPNQVNNVLCFPYIFRGALDCGATRITEAMKLACVREIAALAKAEASDEVAAAYVGKDLKFGPEYLIPTPFDERLILRIAPAVAQAAAESGVATRPIADLEAYRDSLGVYVYQTGMFMRPVFAAAKAQPARVIYAEGEDERVLRAVQAVLDEGLAKPILVGRPDVIVARAERAGLRLKPGVDFEIVNPENDPRFRDCWETYHRLMGRDGVSPEAAKAAVRRSTTLISSLLLKRGDADAMLCGLHGRFDTHFDYVKQVIGAKPGTTTMATMNALMLDQHTLFITDTFVNDVPTAEELAEIAHMAAEEVRRFGVPPKVAFLSHSMFGTSNRPSAKRMRAARDLFVQRAPDIECDGEMHGDAALSEHIRTNILPDSTLKGSANLLVLPNIDAANILFNVLKVTAGQNVTVGPMLLGAAKPAHILSPSATMRRVVNMTALAVADVAAARSKA